MTSGSVAALERAIADACLGEDAGEALGDGLRPFLLARGVATEDIEAIEAAPRRLAVYRSLVQNGVKAVIGRVLPRTRARMNGACAGRFDADVARFLDQAGPRTHYLRDVPGELVAWTEPRWRADAAVPAYLPDLARHEILAFEVGASEDDEASAPRAIELDRPLAFTRSSRCVRYAWSVHELPADEGSTGLPARRDVCLLGHRDASLAVQWLELTPLAAAIVDRLMEGRPLGDAVASACSDHATAPAQVTADVARLLSDLAGRGVLLGPR